MRRLFTIFIMAFSVWFGQSVIGNALAGDATSFNPVPIQVVAKSSGGVPVGTIIAWPVATNPSDWDKWLECNGQAISAAVYPELAALVGAAVPNYQGLFLRGHGSQASSHYGAVMHSSAALGALQGDAIRNISGHLGPMWGGWGNGPFYTGGQYPELSGGWGYGFWNTSFDAGRVVPTASENRPVNKAVRYLIRALP